MCFVHISGEAAASESSIGDQRRDKERRAAVRAATAAEKVDVEKVATVRKVWPSLKKISRSEDEYNESVIPVVELKIMLPVILIVMRG